MVPADGGRRHQEQGHMTPRWRWLPGGSDTSCASLERLGRQDPSDRLVSRWTRLHRSGHEDAQAAIPIANPSPEGAREDAGLPPDRQASDQNGGRVYRPDITRGPAALDMLSRESSTE